MVNIVNEGLFSFNTELRTNAKTQDQYYKLDINTSTKIIRKNAPDSTEPARTVRTFACLTSPEKTYSQYNIIINARDNEFGKRSVMFRAVKESTYNANAFVVAFPFNGIIKPIPFDKRYRIHKGMISMSDEYSIQFNNKNYRKILYLIIEPNMKIFDGDENHDPIEALNIPIESYSLIKDRKNPDAEVKTNFESMTLQITKTGYTVDWENKVIDFVDMQQYKNTPLYNLYTWKPKNRINNSDSSESSNAAQSQNTYTRKPLPKIPSAPRECYDRSSSHNNSRRNNSSYYDKDNDYDDGPHNQKRTGNRGKSSKKRR